MNQARAVSSPPNPSPPAAVSPADALDDTAFAQQVLAIEAEAIRRIRITPAFHEAVDLILAATTPPGTPVPGTPGSAPTPGTPGSVRIDDRAESPVPSGSVVVSGLGKSGLIGQKISATLASTGTPSHFLHPTEAMHGDLGRVRRGDVVLILSFGGNTDEAVSLASILRQDGVPVIAIVGRPDCDLARLASVALCVGDVPEACPLNLAPTASTTAMLALGDALAMAVSRRRNFGVDDFRKIHPGGSLGRQLTPVVQAMRFRAGENLPLVHVGERVEHALRNEARSPGGRRAGALLVVDAAGRLEGIFTDGDLRRLLISRGKDALRERIESVMTRRPRCLAADSLVRDAVQMMREFRIDEIPVIDAQGAPLGLIDVQDLVALKVIEG
jgi:arabinose-5-phosphate isomerase